MNAGKASICRGHELDAARAGPRFAAVSGQGQPAAPLPPLPASLSADYGWIHERLSAVERLVRLYDQGALTSAEFAAEKAVILGGDVQAPLPARSQPVSFVPARTAAHVSRPGPSLIGRVLRWQIMLPGLVAGIVLSLVSQPEATVHFADEALRIFGF